MKIPSTLFLIIAICPMTIWSQSDSSLPRKIDALPSRKKNIDSAQSRSGVIVLPLVSRSIETGWALGVAGSLTLKHQNDDSLTRTSNVQSILLYSLKNQLVAAINGTIYFPKERYILSSQLSLSSFPDKFWGIGKIAPESQEESYTFKQFYLYAHLQRKIFPNFYVGGIYEFQNVFKVDFEKDGLLDKQNVAGRNPYKISGLGASATWDTRNHAFTPTKGTLVQVYFNHFGRYLGSEYTYTNYVLDTRKFFRIYQKQVLALQAYGFFNAGKAVPLRSLASLGGANSMRGFYDGRYRDKNQIVLQAEYRMPIWGRFGMVAFGNTGDVGNSFGDFSLRSLKYSGGLGARFTLSKKENLNLRVDYGIGQGGANGFYIQLGEAF
jgi:outer membrane protein assembly factor BamA